MRTALYIVLGLIVVVIGYVSVTLAYGSATDWTPSGISPVTVYENPAAPDEPLDSVVSFVTWNIGYGGLGADADFFLDAGGFFFSRGKMVHSPADHVERYARGIVEQVRSFKSDFVLLQEVDSMSARSYYRAQLDELRGVRPNDVAAFAPNYINQRVPVPVLEPWHVYGDVYSGLLSFSSKQPAGPPERHQLPGEFPWPDKLFQLDRCLLVQRHTLGDGRTLTVVNLHLSAYDDGSVRAQQLEYVKEFLLTEARAGHLVVAGGDWNLIPPSFRYDRFMADPDSNFVQGASPPDFPASDWTYIYDARTPTNRKTGDPYLRDSSFVTVIDYFLISPGLRARQVRAIRQDFQFSDHQPVYMEVEVL